MTDKAPKTLEASTVRKILALLNGTIGSHERIHEAMLQNLEMLSVIQQNCHDASALPMQEHELKSYATKLQQHCEAHREYLEAIHRTQDELVQKLQELDSYN